jgi:hypothetical protein
MLVHSILYGERVRYGWSTHDEQAIVVVHGGAQGVDREAGDWVEAQAPNITAEVHLPNWRKNGIYNPHAGKLRNSEMVTLGADICYAFIYQNSRGATDCAEKAEAAGIPTVRITI